MPAHVIVPAKLVLKDGVPYAEAFGDVYHSADGGLAQARHVFIGGTGIAVRWQDRGRYTILETGFGLGLNFLATWQTWREDPRRPGQLHYVAIEKHPFRSADLERLHATWPELAPLSRELVSEWPPLVSGMHRIALDGGRVILTLVFGDVAQSLPQLDAGAGFDSFYLDGFAPSKNPDMWAGFVLERLGRLAAPGATLATYTVAAAVRTALGQAGFQCEKRPGFGSKRDMLAAHFAPRWPVTSLPAPRREAIVVGAGLAGCAISARLCARGWKVTLVERHPNVAQETSGNLAGIVLPRLSQDDNFGARIARAAFLFTRQMWQELGGIGQTFDGEACGVLQLARGEKDARAQQRAAELFAQAPELVEWLDRTQIAGRFGLEAAHGGWLFSGGGWVSPPGFCQALLASCGTGVRQLFGREVHVLRHAADEWQLYDAEGRQIAAAPNVILANAGAARHLDQARALPLERVRGQVTHLSADVLPALPLVICGEAYATPAVQGAVSIGATYEFDDDPNLRAGSHHTNLSALATMLPQFAPRLQEHIKNAPEAPVMDGRVGFRCVTPDRLPLVGPVPDPDAPVRGSRLAGVPRLPGLYGLLGYGSRGLIWAPFCAELLAARLENEPVPLERELLDALDPRRFVLKAHRRAGADQ